MRWEPGFPDPLYATRTRTGAVMVFALILAALFAIGFLAPLVEKVESARDSLEETRTYPNVSLPSKGDG